MRMQRRWLGWMVVGLAACGGGAASPGPTGAPVTAAGVRGATGCHVRSVLAVAPVARGNANNREGSAVVLGHLGKKSVAFVADEDARSIIAVDIETKAELARTKLAGAPSAMVGDADGSLLVLLRDRGEVVALEADDESGRLTPRCAAGAPGDAIGIARNGSTVAITGGFSRTLAILDARTLATSRTVDVPREPRSVVLSDDGASAFVSHAVGSALSHVDLRTGKATTIPMRGADRRVAMVRRLQKMQMEALRKQKGTASAALLRQLEAGDNADTAGQLTRPSCQGFALTRAMDGRLVAPQVFVDPGDPDQNPDGYGDPNTPTESPSVAVVDEATRQAVPASLLVRERNQLVDPRDGRPECLLPRAAAVDPKTGSLLVTCFGIDTLVAYDAASPTPVASERKRWIVGSGPVGVAVDSQGGRAVVWSQFDRTLSVVSLDLTPTDERSSRPPLAPRIALGALPPTERPTPEYALGRILFHAASDVRIAQDGRACASCHPDGRDDAITWATPEGPRRSIMLAGRIQKSAPYSWNGTAPDLHTHISHTFERLGGTGLRSIELDALGEYITHLAAPAALHADEAKVARGDALFHAKEAGCATCHQDQAQLADGAVHNVKSRAKSDRGDAFDTPSLHLIGGTGPWFHDGRYATLRDLIRGSDGTMGHTKHISNESDLEALEAYLRTR